MKEYQSIIMTYYSNDEYNQPFSVNNEVRLINDYKLQDVFEAFVEFCTSIGLSMTRENILMEFDHYIKEYFSEDEPENINEPKIELYSEEKINEESQLVPISEFGISADDLTKAVSTYCAINEK